MENFLTVAKIDKFSTKHILVYLPMAKQRISDICTSRLHFCLLEVNLTVNLILVFNNEDEILIKSLYLWKGYGSRKLMCEFPDTGWTSRNLDKLLRKVRNSGSVQRQKGSSTPWSANTAENIDAVNDLVLSQERAPKTQRSTCQISRQTGIRQSLVSRIIHQDLKLKCLKHWPA